MLSHPLSAVLILIQVYRDLLLTLCKANLQQGGKFGRSTLTIEYYLSCFLVNLESSFVFFA
jgi:hypothetical protein